MNSRPPEADIGRREGPVARAARLLRLLATASRKAVALTALAQDSVSTLRHRLQAAVTAVETALRAQHWARHGASAAATRLRR